MPKALFAWSPVGRMRLAVSMVDPAALEAVALVNGASSLPYLK
jgi:hypothetical protein